MKTQNIRKNSNTVSNTQQRVTRTKSVRKRLLGSTLESPTQANPASDLTLAVEFCETMLRTATLLGNRLHELHGDNSTRVIQESLKLAQVNFDAFRARIQGAAQREAL